MQAFAHQSNGTSFPEALARLVALEAGVQFQRVLKVSWSTELDYPNRIFFLESSDGSGLTYWAGGAMCSNLLMNIVKIVLRLKEIGGVIVAAVSVNEQTCEPHHLRTGAH